LKSRSLNLPRRPLNRIIKAGTRNSQVTTIEGEVDNPQQPIFRRRTEEHGGNLGVVEVGDAKPGASQVRRYFSFLEPSRPPSWACRLASWFR
jgi:hypothetical protein